jgi:hypothetical protein
MSEGSFPLARTSAEWLRERAELPPVPKDLRDRWDLRWGKYFPVRQRDASGLLRVAVLSAAPIGLGFFNDSDC